MADAHPLLDNTMTTPTQEEVELTNSMRLHGEFHQTEQQPGSGTHRVNIHLLAEPPLPEAERENTLDHGYIKHASRSQRYKTRILWAIACSFFAVFYPLCIIIALTVTTPYNEGNCVTEFMSSDAFLAPDAAFGKMTVTQARAIDLTWNLVMGRLMPFVMALVSFEVTTLALMSVMEKQGVTYELFATVTLNAHSWLAVIPLSKAAIRSTAWRAKLTLAFMLYSAILILLMPTLMDIQTGYVRRQVPGVRFENGTIIEWQGCQGTGVVLCEIHGEIERVGLVCVDGEGYQWGWSVPWLYTTHVLTGIWSAGSYVHTPS